MKGSGGKAPKIDRKNKVSSFQVSIKFTFTPLCCKCVREFLYSFMRWLHAEKAALSGKATPKWSRSGATSLIHPFPHLKTWVKNLAINTSLTHPHFSRMYFHFNISPVNGWWHPSTPNPKNDQVSFPIRNTLHHEHHQHSSWCKHQLHSGTWQDCPPNQRHSVFWFTHVDLEVTSFSCSCSCGRIQTQIPQFL